MNKQYNYPRLILAGRRLIKGNSPLSFRSFKTLCIIVLCISAFTKLNGQQEVVLIQDINPGAQGAFTTFTFLSSIVYNDKLYFIANDGVHGEEVWVSNGKAHGTHLLKDIQPGNPALVPTGFTPYNGLVYFQANDGVHGRELWVTDGTESGTSLFLDINEGAGHGNPNSFFEYNGKLYFAADDGIHGTELWVSDGTVPGTYMFKEIRPGNSVFGSVPRNFAEYNNKLYFGANDGVHGEELWVTDGTEDGTYMLKDINAGEQSSSSIPSRFRELNGELVFYANDGIHGYELWKTDGTEEGTQMIKDVNPGEPGLILPNITSPSPFVYNNKMFFGGFQGDLTFRMWETDGTEAGTQLFTLPDNTTLDWANFFTLYNGLVYFSAETTAFGEELWRTDGTAAGTSLVKDIHPGSDHSNPVGMTVYNNLLYFTADDGTNGKELWQSDGTETGTNKIVPPFATQSNPVNMFWNQFREVGGSLLFPARYEDIGLELYAVAGPAVGINSASERLFHVYPNPASDFVLIDFGSHPQPSDVVVYNQVGQIVWQQSTQISDLLRINTSDWTPGIYLINFLTDTGRLSSKVVKL